MMDYDAVSINLTDHMSRKSRPEIALNGYAEMSDNHIFIILSVSSTLQTIRLVI